MAIWTSLSVNQKSTVSQWKKTLTVISFKMDGKSAITVFCHPQSQPDMTPMVMVCETTLSLRWPQILILKQW